MNKKLLCKTIIFTLALIPASLVFSEGTSAQQFQSNTDKDIYWVSVRSDLVYKARQNLRAGKIQKARKYYLSSLKTTMRSTDRQAALNDLCVLHNLEGEHERALRYCDKLLVISPENWRGLNNRGTAYFGLGHYEKAQQDFAKAISLNPDDPQLHLNKQMAQKQSGNQYTQK